jgi:hypothetical protein
VLTAKIDTSELRLAQSWAFCVSGALPRVRLDRHAMMKMRETKGAKHCPPRKARTPRAIFLPRVYSEGERPMTELANTRDAYITVRVPRRLVDQLDRLAERELISRSDFVRRELLLAARAADREPVGVSA